MFEFKQIRFIVFGVLTVLIELTGFKVLDYLGLGALFASIISFIFGLTSSYIFNKKLVFRNEGSSYSQRKQVIYFASLAVLNIFVSGLIMYILHERMGIDALAVKVASVIYIATQNYIIYNKFIFRS